MVLDPTVAGRAGEAQCGSRQNREWEAVPLWTAFPALSQGTVTPSPKASQSLCTCTEVNLLGAQRTK